MKDRMLDTIAQILELWTHENTNMTNEERNAMYKFIVSMDKPVEFKLGDHTIIKTGKPEMVEIKPTPILGDYFRERDGLFHYKKVLLEYGFSEEKADKKARELWLDHTGEDYER